MARKMISAMAATVMSSALFGPDGFRDDAGGTDAGALGGVAGDGVMDSIVSGRKTLRRRARRWGRTRRCGWGRGSRRRLRPHADAAKFTNCKNEGPMHVLHLITRGLNETTDLGKCRFRVACVQCLVGLFFCLLMRVLRLPPQ